MLLLVAGGLYLLTVPEDRRGMASLTGGARAVDGDTLRLGGTRVRLLGLDAPELAQKCRDAAGAEWACGSAAFHRLAELVDGSEVVCATRGQDKYGRVLAACSAGGSDLGASLVADGLAVASGGYATQEAEARAEARGIWAGTFERPASWRDGARLNDFWAWLTGLFG